MAVNLIVSSAAGPGLVTSVADGGAVPVQPGSEIRVCLGDGPGIVDLTEMDLSLAGEDVAVRLPDGQAFTLLGYAESLAEQALVQGIADRPAETGDAPFAGALDATAGMVEGWDQPVPFESGPIFGQKVMLDYLGDGEGPDLSRVELYFDQAGDVSVGALFAALEFELGLRDRIEDGAPKIAALTVTAEPLALSDLVGGADGGSDALGALPALAETLGFLTVEEDTLPVNDNSVVINA